MSRNNIQKLKQWLSYTKCRLKRYRLEFKYRKQDPNVCCCGSYIGEGGDICYHGGCRSMVDYVIERELSK